jgi:hypothetical protein
VPASAGADRAKSNAEASPAARNRKSDRFFILPPKKQTLEGSIEIMHPFNSAA